MSENCVSCGVPFADHPSTVGVCKSLKANQRYVAALQVAIIYHCDQRPVPKDVADQCPLYADMLDTLLKKLKDQNEHRTDSQ